MNLLQEIRGMASDLSVPLEAVLLKCVLLADELGDEQLASWARQELDGYANREDAPDYRTQRGQAVARITNGFRREIVNVADIQLPNDAAPDVYVSLGSYTVTDGVRELEATQTHDNLIRKLSPSVKRWIDASLRASCDYYLQEAYIPVPPGAISGILGTIRSRVLQFVIRLRREYPELAEGDISEHAPTQQQLTQNFNVTIAGGSGFSVGGNTFIQSISQQVVAGDLGSLRAYLLGQGIPEGEINQLDELLPAATPEQLQDEASPVRGWIRSAADKVAAGGSELVKTAAKEIIKQAIGAYLDRTLGSAAAA